MKAELRKTIPVIEKLEYNYLVDKDIYSLNTLMSLLYDRNFINFSKHSYYTKDYCFKNLKKYFWNLVDIDEIINSLSRNIGSDIDRYEYLISIKAQFRAFKSKKAIDRLEFLMIEAFGVDFLLDSTNLFYNRDDKEILKIGNIMKEAIISDRELIACLRRDLYNFSDLVLKRKIYDIDILTHKQLTFNTQSIFTEDITSKQTQKIYEKTINYLYRSIVDTYAEYYYRGLIREVFERYQ
ncbi:hypothetical protein [Anaerococcus lactolyticus]|uniref:Uncharacterized protein n=2 Tax=Anaerococcus lactolyticus TaxID=33032 RepID=C2BDC3_9FIRM|nr:hypothetical protein [Anaerococcus lactolyticus]EEI87110.1 hypothetical protein HMPREF0072_0343 [Anaerococcus lactolyticus ATCC 51172]KGF03119.1 hypothetical protein HMPREF1630_09005 [Anaerococcus lactolyticus S7-1-13]